LPAESAGHPLKVLKLNKKFMGFYYVYILFSLKDGKLYIGYTTNLRKRVDYH